MAENILPFANFDKGESHDYRRHKSNGVAGTSGSYDGAFSLATIGIGNGYNGTLRNVRIYSSALSDAQLQAMTP